MSRVLGLCKGEASMIPLGRQGERRPWCPRLPRARGDPDLRTGPQALALGLCVVLRALRGLLKAQTLSPETLQCPWDLGDALRQLRVAWI